MGIPVLHGVMGESAEIVKKNKVGHTFEPENEKQLYELLVDLKDNQGVYQGFHEAGLIASKKYDRSVLAGQFLQLLETVK